MARMRVADVIAKTLAEGGVNTCFMLTGGGAMYLNDAFGRETGMRKVYTHHEQGAAIAAESFARLSGKPALVNVTTGPGGVNTLNGVYGAYVDSIPMVIVSGQVKRETCAFRYDVPLRQLGDQEVDIVAPHVGEHARDRGGDDLHGLGAHRDGGRHADEDQQRRHQKAAADAEQTR